MTSIQSVVGTLPGYVVYFAAALLTAVLLAILLATTLFFLIYIPVDCAGTRSGSCSGTCSTEAGTDPDTGGSVLYSFADCSSSSGCRSSTQCTGRRRKEEGRLRAEAEEAGYHARIRHVYR